MHQWEIYCFPHPKREDPHPCVVLSPEAILQNKRAKAVNVLACQTLYSGDRPDPTDVLLDEADGLDHAGGKVSVHLLFPSERSGPTRWQGVTGTSSGDPSNVLRVLDLLANT